VTDNAEDDPATSANEQQEELASSPDPVLLPGGPLVTWADWRKRDLGGSQPHQEYDVFAAAPGAPNVQVDPHGSRQVSTFSPAACAAGADALVAFGDASAPQSRIRLVRVHAGTRSGPARRVDDGGPRAGDAWRPHLACSHGHVVAAFETERDGPSQVYAATARARALR
jgi:hypothetical protein